MSKDTAVAAVAAVCPRCKSKKVKEEMRLASPGSVSSIGLWRMWWGFGVGLVVLVMGLLAIYIRSRLDPTLATVFLLIGVISLAYALYILATAIYSLRLPRVRRLVCQKCLHSWEITPEGAG